VGDHDDVRDLARPLRDAADLDPLLQRIGSARVVLLGEASHGTHEYYAWRTAITRRLVEERGFSFVAVEGDWPDCQRVHCAVTLASAGDDPRTVLRGYERWPTWMWANEEVADLARWMRAWNAARGPDERVGFHGLDVYSLWDSLRAILEYLQEHEPEHVAAAREAVRCFEPYAEDPQAYAYATRLVPTSCEDPVVAVLRALREAPAEERGSDPNAAFAAEQNAHVAAGAEAYYRAMIRGGPESWNVRDRHMDETLARLLEHYDRRPGGAARAVVWEHNTHVGDARFTDMRDAGMVNVGQLARERYGEDDVVLVGFGSHHGSVVAGDSWGAPMERMPLPPARPGSLEALLHDAVPGASALFVFPPAQPGWLTEERPHRAVGVVYHPGAERWGNYVPTVLGRRYDAFCWFDETRALTPLTGTHPRGGELETYPHGG
jgi:erythromycin esterase-like protein